MIVVAVNNVFKYIFIIFVVLLLPILTCVNASNFKSEFNFYSLSKSAKIVLNFSPEFLKVAYINLVYYSAKESPVGAYIFGSA